MSASESESPPEPSDGGQFVEHEKSRTLLGYDSGGVPLYIAVAWVVFICAYIVVMSILSLPDLMEWIGR